MSDYIDQSINLRILDMWAGETVGVRAGNRYDVQGTYRDSRIHFEMEALSQLNFYLKERCEEIDEHVRWVKSFKEEAS